MLISLRTHGGENYNINPHSSSPPRLLAPVPTLITQGERRGLCAEVSHTQGERRVLCAEASLLPKEKGDLYAPHASLILPKTCTPRTHPVHTLYTHGRREAYREAGAPTKRVWEAYREAYTGRYTHLGGTGRHI